MMLTSEKHSISKQCYSGQLMISMHMAIYLGFTFNGYKACPICDNGTDCQYLKNSRKFCYIVHLKFLPLNHVYRNWKNTFNSAQERNLAPQSLTGKELLEIISKLQYKLRKKIQVGKEKRKRKRRDVVRS